MTRGLRPGKNPEAYCACGLIRPLQRALGCAYRGPSNSLDRCPCPPLYVPRHGLLTRSVLAQSLTDAGYEQAVADGRRMLSGEQVGEQVSGVGS